MVHELSDNAHYRLIQTRDIIRLLKHTSQEAEPGAMLETALLAGYLTLMDEQLSSVIDDAGEANARVSGHV